MNRSSLFDAHGVLGTILAAGAIVATAVSPLHAQPSGGEFGGAGAAQRPAPPADLTTRVYPVADLVFAAPNYPYDDSRTQATGFQGGFGSGNGGFGGGGGGFGGGGFGKLDAPSGGFFAVSDDVRVAQAAGAMGGRGMGGGTAGGYGGAAPSDGGSLTIDALANAIQTSLSPDSWNMLGGHGTIVPLGGRLIVTQTPAVHAEIERLLAALRADGGGRESVTVRAWWLPLDNEGYRRLTEGASAGSPPRVNREQLVALAEQYGADYGEITCFDHQTVHIVSGRFRSAVKSAIPVVGSLDEQATPWTDNAQLALAPTTRGTALYNVLDEDDTTQPVAADASIAQLANGRGVGYQPVIGVDHSGTVLEVTPARLPERGAVVLDLHSVVTRIDQKPGEPVLLRGVVPLDLSDELSQRLATTIKAPLGTPVLVGGLTFEPAQPASDGAKTRLYLVVEAIEGAKDAPPSAASRGREE